MWEFETLPFNGLEFTTSSPITNLLEEVYGVNDSFNVATLTPSIHSLKLEPS